MAGATKAVILVSVLPNVFGGEVEAAQRIESWLLTQLLHRSEAPRAAPAFARSRSMSPRYTRPEISCDSHLNTDLLPRAAPLRRRWPPHHLALPDRHRESPLDPRGLPDWLLRGIRFPRLH